MTDNNLKTVELFSDGACSGNPGKGGYGTILKYRENRKEFSEGFRLTTNNRMEILGVLKGFEALKEPCNVIVTSDSKYVIDALSKGWVFGWKKKGWIKSDKKAVKNIDLWERLLREIAKHNVTYEWVKGHANHPENERCDELAVSAYSGAELKIDTEYERTHENAF